MGIGIMVILDREGRERGWYSYMNESVSHTHTHTKMYV